ncbi:MAG: CoA-binding protein [Trueperaceae bacterium]
MNDAPNAAPTPLPAATDTLPDAPPDPALRDLLDRSRTIAVLGASTDQHKPAHEVPEYLRRHGYDVLPVNPAAAGEELFGERVAATLAELDRPVDIVDVFRRAEAIPAHVDDILSMDPLPKVVWLQLGIRNDEVAARLRHAGITVIQDRCIKIEHARLLRRQEA